MNTWVLRKGLGGSRGWEPGHLTSQSVLGGGVGLGGRLELKPECLGPLLAKGGGWSVVLHSSPHGCPGAGQNGTSRGARTMSFPPCTAPAPQECQAGLNFAHEGEADVFRALVDEKMKKRQQRLGTYPLTPVSLTPDLDPDPGPDLPGSGPESGPGWGPAPSLLSPPCRQAAAPSFAPRHSRR